MELIKQPKYKTPAKPDTKCRFCSYEFKKRVANPRECPNCKKRDFEVVL